MELKKLPVGIERFQDFFSENFYYVDKTGFIIDLLHNWGLVNLFTRPRRFGKSLNMSMLQAFFEIDGEKASFDGLKIAEEKELCDAYMGKYPVISISLKGVEGLTYQAALSALRIVIGNEAMRFQFLKNSKALSEEEKRRYGQLIEIDENGEEVYAMSGAALSASLQTLSVLLQKHYGRKVILLIDEYDVPLDKAFEAGYYEEMVSTIRRLFHNALKTNASLQFAVLTGCLRISKESIFTGFNNLKVHTITDTRYDEYFGFTDKDVKELLYYYGLSEHYDRVREWYNGYRFGDMAVYCPWDVMNYCDEARHTPEIWPKNYWANTSGNTMVRRLIQTASQQTKDEIELLVDGKSIIKPVNQELTYHEVDKSVQNLWSVLFTTGYLTQCRQVDETRYELRIPNREIKNLFVMQIQEWFMESSVSDTEQIENFCMAFPERNVVLIEKMLGDYLWNSISVRDTAVREEKKENFYHGMLLGLLQYKNNWKIKSNAESGEGYCDILIETPKRVGVVIEVKYAQDANLEAGCERAVAQIAQNHYEALLKDDGMKTIIKYGIAFYKKSCKVILG